MNEHDITFHSMGSDVRLLIGAPLLPRAEPPAPACGASAPTSRTSRCGSRAFVPTASSACSTAIRAQRGPGLGAAAGGRSAGLWAAQRSGGLVDPTRRGRARRAGYASSLDGREPASLAQALAAAPARATGPPESAAALAPDLVDDRAGTVRRPAGARSTRAEPARACAPTRSRTAFVATRASRRLRRRPPIGGVGAQLDPYAVEIEHPFTGETIRTIASARAGSRLGLERPRLAGRDGRFAHHLLDPVDGRRHGPA